MQSSDGSYSSQDEDESMGMFQHLYDEKKMPKFQSLNLNQDIVQFDTLKLSLTKLKKKKTPQQIKQLYEEIHNQVSKSHFSLLEYIQFQLLSSVVEFTGKQYQHRYKYNQMKSQNITMTLRLISHITFPNLQKLKINNLSITNVQSLTWIQAPNLKCLQLYGCEISNLNTLVKANFPKLQIITFYRNPITQIEKFCRFHSKKLTGYEFDNKSTYENRVEDYRFLFKMENPVPKMIKVQDDKRIDISKRKSYKILNQPGTKILIFIGRSFITLLQQRLRMRD